METRLPLTAVRKWLIFAVLLVSACARPVFEAPEGATALTPADAVEDWPRAEGRRVIWGGRVVGSRNLADSTELVVLGLPLSRSQRPRVRGEPVGRFIVRYPGYLETMVYAPDRLVTVDARVTGRETRPVGEARYQYPVVRAETVHLWPESGEDDSGFRFGVGIGIGN